MKKSIILLLLIFVYVSSPAKGERDFLKKSFSRQMVNASIIKNDSWINYPAYKDRAGWAKIPAKLRTEYINLGEKYLGYQWPTITLTMYMDYYRTGNRRIQENPWSQRKNALESLVFAELMEGKGRFMDDIINGVWSFCELTYWGWSAHLYLNGPNTNNGDSKMQLPDIENSMIDLGVGELSNELAWTWYFFHKEFDKINPVISYRLKSELKNKVLKPFYERNDFWWMGGIGSVNNWNPWCNYNVLNCIMILEENPVKRAQGVLKTMTSVDYFINDYEDDGGCDEGPSYWNAAGGKLFSYLDLLKKISNGKIDLFNNDLVKNIGRYIYHMYIGNGVNFANFGDCGPVVHQSADIIYRYGRSIKDPKMEGFGAFLLKQYKFLDSAKLGTTSNVLEALFNMNGWQDKEQIEILESDHYFPDLQVATARDNAQSTKGFYFVAKGANNGESHNHNDVGSFIMYYNGTPVFIDPGVGTYTKKTFSSNRYDIWTMRSLFHNLPVINGVEQHAGEKYKSKNSEFKTTNSKVSFSTDIAGAYPSDANVKKWVRSYRLDRGKRFRITDSYQLTQNNGKSQLVFMTCTNCKIIKPGIVELTDDKNIKLKILYNPSKLYAHIETKEIEDSNLQKYWGKELSRIVFDIRNKKLQGNVLIDIF